jgi:hypothetical protein
VDRLRADLDQARESRGEAVEADTGTGGSGSASASKPRALASAIFEGRVSKVSKKTVEVIDRETGEPYVLRVTEGTRARSGQQRIPVTGIREGSEVRASFDFVGGATYATQIDVLRTRRR